MFREKDIVYQPLSVKDVSTANATLTTPNNPTLHILHSQKKSTHVTNAVSDLQSPSPEITESQKVQSSFEKINTLQKISESDLNAHRRHASSLIDISGSSSNLN